MTMRKVSLACVLALPAWAVVSTGTVHTGNALAAGPTTTHAAQTTMRSMHAWEYAGTPVSFQTRGVCLHRDSLINI